MWDPIATGDNEASKIEHFMYYFKGSSYKREIIFFNYLLTNVLDLAASSNLLWTRISAKVKVYQ